MASPHDDEAALLAASFVLANSLIQFDNLTPIQSRIDIESLEARVTVDRTFPLAKPACGFSTPGHEASNRYRARYANHAIGLEPRRSAAGRGCLALHRESASRDAG